MEIQSAGAGVKVEELYCQIRALLRIQQGASEVQKLIIALKVLG